MSGPQKAVMPLSELATKKVATLTATEPIARALAIMQEKGIQHLPVVQARVPVGMVTDHDILHYVGWLQKREQRATAPSKRVDTIMVKPLKTLSIDDPVERAAHLMLNRRIGAVPLLCDQGRIAGIVTESDFLKFFTQDNDGINSTVRSAPIAETMSSQVYSVAPGDPTLHAVRLMSQNRVRHLPVVENDRLVGILTDRDILSGKSEASSRPKFGRPTASMSPLHVRGIMTNSVVTLQKTDTLQQAALVMIERNVGALPITEDGRLIGILTESDFLGVFVDQTN